MTKEGILEMVVGRGLDVLVAKEVFGIEVEWDYRAGDINHVLPKLPYLKGEPRMVLGPMAHSIGNTVPEYSTSVSAAWLVVDKLRLMEDGKGNQLLCCLKMHCDVPGEVWDIHWSYSEFSAVDDGHKDHKLPMSWDSFPEAICKAALLIKLEVRQ